MVIIAFVLRIKHQKRCKATSWAGMINDLDPLGTAAFLPAVVCLLLALQWGGTKYAWSSGPVIAPLVLSVVLFIAFGFIQVWRGEKATVPPRIIRQRTLAFASLFSLLLSSAYFAIVYYIPIWFQAIKGASAVKSGIMCLPMILAVVIFSLIAGGGVTVCGYFVPFAYASSILTTIGAGLITTFDVDTSHPKWIGYQFLFGAGVGLGIQLGVIASQSVLKLEDIAIGTAIITLCQTLGGAIFISVAQSIFGNLLSDKVAKVIPGAKAGLIQQVGATNLKDVIDPQYYLDVLKAYNDALSQTWYIAVALAALSIVGAAGMEWRSVKKPATAKEAREV